MEQAMDGLMFLAGLFTISFALAVWIITKFFKL